MNKRELQNLFHKLGGIMLIFLSLFSLLYGSAVGVQLGMTTVFPRSELVYIITDLICSFTYAAAFLLPIPVFYLMSRGTKTQPMGLSLRCSTSRPVFYSLAIVFWGIALCISCSYLNSLFPPITQGGYDLREMAKEYEGYRLILSFISTAIIPAFVEELLFRGLILSQLRPYSQGSAVVISALLFGLMHQSPFQFLYATAMGIVLGIMYIKTNSIWLCVMLHFFNNFYSVVQTYLLYQFGLETGAIISNILTIAVVGMGGIFGCLFFAIYRKDLAKSPAPWGLFRKERYAPGRENLQTSKNVWKAALSPLMLMFVVLSLATMIYNIVILL